MAMFEMYVVAKTDMVIPRSILYEADIKKIMRECKTDQQFHDAVVEYLKAEHYEFFKAFLKSVKFECRALMRDDPDGD